MSSGNVKEKAMGLLRKFGSYKYAIIILLLGIVLMMVPTKNTSKETVENVSSASEDDFPEKLEDTLGLIDGAGRVKVLLTKETGVLTEFQSNIRLDEDDNGIRRETETVLISVGGGTEEALIKKTVCPIYRGALILCDGADSAAVRLRIVQAVSGLTGLGSDKITVIKMRGN